MKYIVIERKMLIAYVIQPMGTYRTGADDDVIHDRQCHQSGSHDIAAVRRVKKRDVSFESVAPSQIKKSVNVENV